jgi:hypothetical protein
MKFKRDLPIKEIERAADGEDYEMLIPATDHEFDDLTKKKKMKAAGRGRRRRRESRPQD